MTLGELQELMTLSEDMTLMLSMCYSTGLDTPSFALMASIRAAGILSIGVGNGYLFAGNAALLGTCDFIIATRGGNKSAGSRAGKTSIGMGGPAMISGGGLGDFKVRIMHLDLVGGKLSRGHSRASPFAGLLFSSFCGLGFGLAAACRWPLSGGRRRRRPLCRRLCFRLALAASSLLRRSVLLLLCRLCFDCRL